MRPSSALSLVLLAGVAPLAAQATWTQQMPLTNPAGRTGSAFASDGGGLLVFGGSDGTFYNDLWRYDGNDWTDITPATGSPAPRYRQNMAYDPLFGRLVMFGGGLTNQGSSRQGDTWVHDGTRWTQAMVNGPSARWWHSMAYDPINGKVLLFGGEDSSGRLNDTWHYDVPNATWTQLSPTNVPPVRERAAMALNPVTGRILLFGGNPGGGTELGDTWMWDGFDWNPITTATIPYGTGTRNAGMTYDPIRERFVLFGGITGGVFRANTWEFDGQDWIDRGVSPLTPRTFPAIAYVLALGRTVLFSGFGGTNVYFPGTWTYQTSTFASFSTNGSGCMGSTTAPSLSSSDLPWLGETFTYTVSPPGPAAQVFAFVGVSNTMWTGGMLPLDLAILGAPGCLLQSSNEVAVAAIGSVNLPLPLVPSLAGGTLYTQGIAVEAGNRLSVSERGDILMGLK